MTTLGVQYLGIPFENPFLLASAPPTANAEMLLRAFEQGWAGAVIKTLIAEPVHNVRNRFAAYKTGNRLVGFQNFELLSERAPEEWYEDIKHLKRSFPHKRIVGSIMSDARSPEGWIDLALGLQDAGVDLLELNFSCPHGYPEKGEGAAIGQSAEHTGRIVSWLAACTDLKIPIVPKLTAATADISRIGEAARAAGAHGLSAINTLPSFMGFDLQTLQPRPSIGGYSTTGGYSGPGIKPVALRCIYELAKSPGLPIMAGGGISTGSDAAEFLLLGAPLVQICTAVMFEGYGIISRLSTELSDFMHRHQFEQPADFLGRGLKRIVAHEELSRRNDAVAHVDRERCTGCGKCVTACGDAAYQAIAMHAGQAFIDTTRCSGCSLCTHVCPSGALSLA